MTTEAEVYETLKYRIDVNHAGTCRYYNVLGQLHREEGPAIIWADGSMEWWQNGQRHCIGGPAVEWGDGTREWYQNGVRHREDGPAYVGYRESVKEWWQRGLKHRIDGPAIEYANGYQEWWLNGNTYIESEYYAKLKALGHTP